MQDRRLEERTRLDGTIVVEDADSDDPLGVLVDLSPSGLRISGDEPIAVFDEAHLRLCLGEEIFGKKRISCGAICVWSGPDEETGKHLSGFKFTEVSRDAVSLILGLILQSKCSGNSP